MGGPGGQYPKGHRAGAPFQTGQNWPLSWELRAFEAKQRPGLIPAPPTGASEARSEASAPPAASIGGAGGRVDAEEVSAGSLPPTGGAASEASDGAAGPPARATGSPGSAPDTAASSFALYSGRLIYDEGAMVRRTAHLRRLQRKPFLEMNEYDVKRLEIADGDEVVVSANGFEVRLKVVVADISPGDVFIPYDQEGLRANRLMAGVDPVVEVRPA